MDAHAYRGARVCCRYLIAIAALTCTGLLALWAAGGPPANDPTGLSDGRPGIGRLPTPNQPELEIGPIEGLTTAWHQAPREVAIPVGTTLLFRTKAVPAVTVTWTGAIEISRDEMWSTAICSLPFPGAMSCGLG